VVFVSAIGSDIYYNVKVTIIITKALH
jgi:hypothetical protein